ncbi:SusD/RagB family nutrient-binding outer membrane lipoprotein [Pseudofulvibacter geojedonensis]|uniref:SusD/RagB family nutrient-binding outer membrane lipoprotein n=1 Tax=Pseudofulvibacter geojedonensis TaxID=1123758 RepID=A0ABW3I4S0_9FLAO
MKKTIKISTLLLLFISVISCDSYLDVNDALDNQPLDQLNPNELMVGAQETTAATFTNRLNRVGNFMAVAWSGDYQAVQSAYPAESTYLFTSTFYNDVWDDLYRYTSNLTTIENYNDGQDWSNHKAAAKILKAFYLQYIVDLYGNAPFSEAHNPAILFPVYDNGEDIYKGLITLTDEAIALIDNNSNALSMNATDITFQGNMTLWKQFANTVKLRLLNRLTIKAGQDANLNTYVQSKFAELNGVTFISQNVMVNPGYSNQDNAQNPFWESYGANVAGVATFNNLQTGPSQFAFNLLDNSNDPRLNRLWKPGSGIFQGTQQNGGGGAANIGDGILTGPDQPLPIMLAAESYLLQAEAIERGFLTGGSAQALFNQGVAASFSHLGAGSSTAYLAANSTDQRLAYGAGNNLEAILTQKWIALTSVSGAELWIEYNRTGFPANLPLPAGSTDPNIPVRLLYPASEYSGNSANVVNQERADAFTSKVFWDVN